MALVKLDIGAEVDIATGDELKGLGKDVFKHLNSRPKPLYNSTAMSIVGDGAPMVVDFGSPGAGSLWELMSIVTFGSDAWNSIPNLSAAVFLGTLSTDALSMPLGQLLLPGLSFPGLEEFPKGVMIHGGTNVVLAPSAAPLSGQQLGGVIRYRVWDVADVMKVSGP